MKAARPSGRSGRRRAGLSSVYGFIMIYLLVIASLQAVSSALSSSEKADAAAQQAAQVSQTRSLERLSVAMSRGGNVTITNDGLIPSQLSYLLLQNSTVSKELPVADSLPVGSSVVIEAGSTGAFPSSVAVVTSLGNVFASSPAGAAFPGRHLEDPGGRRRRARRRHAGLPEPERPDALLPLRGAVGLWLFRADGGAALVLRRRAGRGHRRPPPLRRQRLRLGRLLRRPVHLEPLRAHPFGDPGRDLLDEAAEALHHDRGPVPQQRPASLPRRLAARPEGHGRPLRLLRRLVPRVWRPVADHRPRRHDQPRRLRLRPVLPLRRQRQPRRVRVHGP